MHQTPTDSLRNKDIREQTPGIIESGQGFYQVDNELIPDHDFISRFPLGTTISADKRKNAKGNENPDKTHI